MNNFNNIIESVIFTKFLSGEIWECGTHNGDTAIRIKTTLNDMKDDRLLRMFDTFTGQPFSGPYDFHKQGSMNGVNFDNLQNRFSGNFNYYFHSGIMPFTFKGLEKSKISVANIDVDNYDSVKDLLEFVYPRTEISGYIFIDDYGCPNCPGAKKATDEFLKDKKEIVQGPGNPQVYIIKE